MAPPVSVAAVIEELGAVEIEALLREAVVGRVGCHVDGLTYVVPVIYAYDGEAVWVVTVEGQKTQMMRANPRVCFEVDEYAGPGSWRSVIVQGTYEELDAEGLAQATALLSERFAGRGSGRRPNAGGRTPVAFRIRMAEATGRAVRGQYSSDEVK
jgi:nitroimidazol reductase NimA-like FMN-containing flavoprotein (pyridoxamine 5'-phosphate oxidase superfamily)